MNRTTPAEGFHGRRARGGGGVGRGGQVGVVPAHQLQTEPARGLALPRRPRMAQAEERAELEKTGDFIVDEKGKTVTLTEMGMAHVEKLLAFARERGIGPEYIDMAFEWAHEADPDAPGAKSATSA